MKSIPILAFCLATSATFGQSPVVGVDIRNGGRYFTSTADASFVANFVSPAPTGALPLFALDFDAPATTLWAVNNATNEYGIVNVLAGTFTPAGVIGGIPTLSTTGLTASPNGTTWYLSAVFGGVSSLFAGDITTGTFALVGPMAGAGLVIDISMSSAGRLVAHDIFTDTFFDIDPGTAVATPIGLSGVNANFCGIL